MSDAAFYTRPASLLAGFHAERPEPAVPELVHLGEQWVPRTFQIGPHAHAVWEWYVQESGSSRWAGPDGEEYALGAGGFLAVPPGARHALRERPPARHHFFFAAVDVQTLAARFPDAASAWAGERVLWTARGETLLAPFRLLTREVTQSGPLRAAGVRAALDMVFVEATRLVSETVSGPILVARHPATAAALSVMERAPGEAWTLARLAAAADVSPAHLSDVFARDMGVPPHRFLVDVRVRRASEMLRESDLPITDIALEMGFASAQHFAAAFKKATGQTARQWRAGR